MNPDQINNTTMKATRLQNVFAAALVGVLAFATDFGLRRLL